MGSAYEPRHTATESTIVFDLIPCTVQAARRVYNDGGQHPQVCTLEEYSDIYNTAVDRDLATPRYDCCCCCACLSQRSTGRQEKVLTHLRRQFPNLDLRIQKHPFHLVLFIRSKQQQQTEASHGGAKGSSPPPPAALSPSAPSYEQVTGGTVTTVTAAASDDGVPVVQAIPINDRK